ncbi:GDSL esterase/lipase [Dichanthelium oligosanthes]|uniref:GDSL esterase/lipase n=1 Tax=Dichanthelium oligosanthes TaxID=888268 RepID=A0A1E5V5S5_9POAL|nr:GDSL esterase/lipase [Dichanthelium oligosanthes]
MLFVFGDSFVDAGNLPKSAKSVTSRGWYYPYGSSDSAHRNTATGRLSDGLVQSDYLAMMLGNNESPPPYRADDDVDASGVNFATSFSGALNGPQEQPALGRQIDQFRRLVNRRIIDGVDLQDSIALVSVSNGHDYSHVSDSTSSDQMNAYIRDVTDRIVDAVKRLQDLGVSKVLVNSLPPVGCIPWRARLSNYARCDARGNDIATTHNALLRQKLGDLDDVLLLDLYATFRSVAQSNSGSTPCCDTSDPNAYCGQEDGSGRAQYSVCANPGSYFYWDYLHPTQAGWNAVMDQLQGPIEDFLAI